MSFEREDVKTPGRFFLRVFALLSQILDASGRSTIAVVLLAVSPGVLFAEWPTYHGGTGLTGFSVTPLPDQPALLWRVNTGGAVDSTPVSDGERIFFSARKGQVVALDLKGASLWKKSFTRINSAGQEMPLRFDAPLVCADDLVFAGASRGTLLALDAATGAEHWRYETDGIFIGSPNFIQCGAELDRKDAKTQSEDNGRVFTSSSQTFDTSDGVKNSAVVVFDQSEGSLHCIDMKTGERLWKTEGVERCDGSPGASDGRIVFGSCLSALHVYSTADGSHLKDIEIGTDAQVAGGVAVDGNFAFAGARDGSLLCADLEQGELIWVSHESEDQTFSTPALSSSRVVYSSDDGFVYALNREDGERIWKFDTAGLPTSPVVAKDTVAVSADGLLFLLNLADGTKIWSKEISDEITSPALVNGMIIVGADDGTVSVWGENLNIP